MALQVPTQGGDRLLNPIMGTLCAQEPKGPEKNRAEQNKYGCFTKQAKLLDGPENLESAFKDLYRAFQKSLLQDSFPLFLSLPQNTILRPLNKEPYKLVRVFDAS